MHSLNYRVSIKQPGPSFIFASHPYISSVSVREYHVHISAAELSVKVSE